MALVFYRVGEPMQVALGRELALALAAISCQQRLWLRVPQSRTTGAVKRGPVCRYTGVYADQGHPRAWLRGHRQGVV